MDVNEAYSRLMDVEAFPVYTVRSDTSSTPTLVEGGGASSCVQLEHHGERDGSRICVSTYGYGSKQGHSLTAADAYSEILRADPKSGSFVALEHRATTDMTPSSLAVYLANDSMHELQFDGFRVYGASVHAGNISTQLVVVVALCWGGLDSVVLEKTAP